MIGEVCAVGLGPGARDLMAPAAMDAIRNADVIVGYVRYIDQIRDLVDGKELVETGMGAEVERCLAALQAAAAGRTVCVVCSGDAGFLAMAGLLYELRAKNPSLETVPIRVVPGITAAAAAAAAVGAPMQNGCCLVSLSDLLTPADEVLRNVRAAASSTLCCALYNPAGRRRRELLAAAIDIFQVERGSDTPAAWVRNATRPDESRWLGLLKDLPQADVDMSSIILIGGLHSVIDNGAFYETRGYDVSPH